MRVCNCVHLCICICVHVCVHTVYMHVCACEWIHMIYLLADIKWTVLSVQINSFVHN